MISGLTSAKEGSCEVREEGREVIHRFKTAGKLQAKQRSSASTGGH
ncbi:MAG: hypothetical protein HC780_22940 [Leptolyngbyaceae cyanobacterium CSU_1_3]|nr:hypothetical protein [Leptolyngbyaceae cyanobacterium CSU_1_3]